jgi:hypothetical protein
MLGRTSAPTSADAGMVKTDRKDVGVPLGVVLQPDFVGVADCEAWACIKLRQEASTAEAKSIAAWVMGREQLNEWSRESEQVGFGK